MTSWKHSIGVVVRPDSSSLDMSPKLGLLGPIDCLLVYLAQSFVSLCKTFPNPTECDLHGYEADHLSTLSSLLFVVLEVFLVIHNL